MKVLVINAGSSSMKFTLFSMANNTVLAKGQFERLGTDKPNMIYKRLSDGLKFEGIVPVRNLEEALKRVCAKLVDPADGVMKDLGEIVAIGHRVLLGGEKITIRVLSSTAGPMTLKDAGVSGENLKIMQSAIRMPSGMILMCGPTGSGKTSTLYAMLQAIDYSMKNVISIEDPIEHVMENISQMEVNTKADITFAKLLRNALRQNPDIICLGEIRDEETAQVSAHAAQTGHLIIATVHSNDNLGTIDRLVNLGIPLRSVAATLQLIVSQRRKLCRCKKPVELSPELKEYFKSQNLSTKNVCGPVGCRECDGTGYSGRTALFDLMIMNNSLRSALEAEGATLSSIKEKIEAEHGSTILAYEGFKLVAAGVTSVDEVERVTLNLEAK